MSIIHAVIILLKITKDILTVGIQKMDYVNSYKVVLLISDHLIDKKNLLKVN